MTKDGNTEADIKTMTNKARGAFAALKNIWKTKMISKKTRYAFSRAMYYAYYYMLQSLGK